MKRVSFAAIAALILVGSLGWGQDEYDTIFKFPDRRSKNIKVIKGIVTKETKTDLVYTIGAGQTKHIEPELVIKVIYHESRQSRVEQALRNNFLKGLSEFNRGNYEDAKIIFEKGLKDARPIPTLSKWIVPYHLFYAGRSYLEMGKQMEKGGLLEALIKKRYQNAVTKFKQFEADHPDHRLQYDLPVPYATALMKLGKDHFGDAITILNRVQTSSRNQHAQLRKLKALKLKADIHREAQEHGKSLDTYSELLRIVPSENAIDDITEITQEVRVFVGLVHMDKGKKNKDDTAFSDAEDYFKKILTDVSSTGVIVSNMGQVYQSIGECRAHFKDWESAYWYFLHGCIAYFDDPEVHRQCLYNVIIALDNMIQKAEDRKRKQQLANAIKEYYRQLNVDHGPSTERMKARDVYKKYKSMFTGGEAKKD